MKLTAQEIAEMIGGRVHGDPATPITGVNGIKEARPGDLCFVRDARYAAFLATTQASAVLIASPPPDCPITAIQVGAPDLAFARILHLFATEQAKHPQGRHPTAVVASSVMLGDGVALGPHVVIEEGARIGDRAILYAGVYVGRDCVVGPDTILYPNVTLREGTEIGARCVIHAGAAIGSDGFGFAPMDGKWLKIPQAGRVVIEDDVEIGSNTAIDRATFGITRIGRGTKIDNLVQVGHNVVVGENCAIAGQAGIAGSAIIAEGVRIGAQSGITGHIDIGAGATIAACAGVTKGIAPGAVVSGFPATDHRTETRIKASLRWVPDLIRRVKQLERQIEALEAQRHGKTTDD
jgi:UDP-3-O-[3-hydroxymyristoyl] glucosamine N-acyltransferase